MVGQRFHAIILATSLLACPLLAQDAPEEPPFPPLPPPPSESAEVPPPMPPEEPLHEPGSRFKDHKKEQRQFEKGRHFLEKLPPEQREKMRKNMERWKNLPPEQRDALREQEKIRRERIRQEIERVIQESGLQLEGDRREQFVRRYMQERRKIEEGLRREMEEKRRPLLKDALEKLKTEFSAAPTPVPEPSPTATP